MFGINGPEFLVLALIALLVVGPERLPQYAAQLGRLVRELRRMANGAREQVRAELGPDFDDIDWQKLDPRQYDPRRIVREALSDALDDEPGVRRPRARSTNGNGAARPGGASAAGNGTASGRSGPAARSGDSGRSGEPGRSPSNSRGTVPFDTDAT